MIPVDRSDMIQICNKYYLRWSRISEMCNDISERNGEETMAKSLLAAMAGLAIAYIINTYLDRR